MSRFVWTRVGGVYRFSVTFDGIVYHGRFTSLGAMLSHLLAVSEYHRSV